MEAAPWADSPAALMLFSRTSGLRDAPSVGGRDVVPTPRHDRAPGLNVGVDRGRAVAVRPSCSPGCLGVRLRLRHHCPPWRVSPHPDSRAVGCRVLLFTYASHTGSIMVSRCCQCAWGGSYGEEMRDM